VLEALARRLQTREQVSIALDPASSEIYDKSSGRYVFKNRTSPRTHPWRCGVLDRLDRKISIVSIEDGHGGGRLGGMEAIDTKRGEQVERRKFNWWRRRLFVTNTERLSRGINEASPTRF